MTEAATLADLRRIDLFDELDDTELQQWVDVAEIRYFDPGEVLEDVGVPVSGLLLLLDGTCRSFLVEQNRLEPVGRQLPPTWMGAIAALTEGPLGVRMVAETRCRIAHVDAAVFRRLALSQPAVHRRVMRQVGPVVSRLTGMEHNRERLAALGTMAAGLAHELNNPAAAARRAAAGVVEELEVVNAALASFVESGIERAEAAQLLGLQREALARAAEATALDALDAADAEDELRDRLEAMGVGEAWRLAEPLAAAGVDQEWLDRVARLAGEATGAALRWVAASLTAGRLAAELEEATGRMSALVSAVKSYAYMDRGALVEVDLHEGLETTLTVLGHKLKHTAIAVRRDYDRGLPRLTVRGPELNQVWTNLLDNAIDALGERGTIEITTRADGSCAVVEIADDGPGVPAEIQDRVFDPFFTTKEVGHGTGLGLATARQIVVDRHDGSVTLESRPGHTSFTIRIPFTQR